MSYEAPSRRSYRFPAQAFDGSARYFKGPKGKRGRIVEVMISPTVAFVGTMTPGYAQVDDGVTAGKFAKVAAGAAGAGAAVGAPVVASDYAGGLNALVNNGQSVFMDKDTAVKVTFVAPTGGVPAGTADVDVVVDWS